MKKTWIWFDIFSIPQADRKKQLLAIDSIQYYSATISRFVPLVRDEKQWRDSFGTEPSRMYPGGPVRGALATYRSRGWCRLEVFCALCPKRFKDGSWRPGPIGLRHYYHTALPDVGGAGDAVGSGFDSGFGADGLDSAGLEMGGGTWAAEMTSAWKQR